LELKCITLEAEVPADVPLTTVGGLYRVVCMLPQVPGSTHKFAVLVEDMQHFVSGSSGNWRIDKSGLFDLVKRAEIRCDGFESIEVSGRHTRAARFRTKIWYAMDFWVSEDGRLAKVQLPDAEIQLGWTPTTREHGLAIQERLGARENRR
jgi:hypothetical protein